MLGRKAKRIDPPAIRPVHTMEPPRVGQRRHSGGLGQKIEYDATKNDSRPDGDSPEGRNKASKLVDKGLCRDLDGTGRELSQEAGHPVPPRVARRIRQRGIGNRCFGHAFERLSFGCDCFHARWFPTTSDEFDSADRVHGRPRNRRGQTPQRLPGLQEFLLF